MAKRYSQLVFSPRLGHLVAEHETTSARVRHKLSDYLNWCFCELCGDHTEFAKTITLRARGIFDLAGNSVGLTKAMCDKAERVAEFRAKSYERALKREHRWPVSVAANLILKYCGIDGWRKLHSDELRDRDATSKLGEISVEQFRLYVEGQERMRLWAERGFIGVSPGRNNTKPSRTKDPEDESPDLLLSRAGEPSKLYCSNHNQQRSESARRNYQRDRQAIDEFQILIRKIWSEQAGSLPTWDIAAHAYVRQEAYRHLQYLRPLQQRLPSGMVHELVAQGITNQSEIARRLGVSRQAVSAALKHKKGCIL